MDDGFDPYAPSSDERYAAMAGVRAGGGMLETPAGWYVATAEGVSTGLHDVEKFVGSFVDTSALDEDDVMISAIPEPRHGRIRRVINTVVAAHRTLQNEPFIRDRARELVARRGRCGRRRPDRHRGHGGRPTSRGGDRAHARCARRHGRTASAPGPTSCSKRRTPEDPARSSAAHPEFADFVQGLIDERRADPDPPDDVVTRFINTDVDGEYLSDRAIRTQTMFLIVAGNETTRNLIGNCLFVLATRPDLFAQLRDDPSLVGAVRRGVAPARLAGAGARPRGAR